MPTSGPNPTDLLYDDDYSSKVYAVFGQIAYDVMDNLELALALRYDSEDREVSNNVPVCTGTDLTSCRAQTPGFSFFSNPYINPAYTVNPAYATSGIPNRSETFDQLQPKISANWKLTDDFALFASYGYGFRSGGFNSSGSAATVDTFYGLAGSTPLCLGDNTTGPNGPVYAPACDATSQLNLTDVNDTFKQEVSKAAELGFKSYFLDRSVSVNAALFYTTVEDMQFFNFFAGPFGLLRAVTNIDEVTIKGAEIDARWQINEMFTVFAGYGITDGEIDKYSGRPYTKGNEVPYAPEYTGNIGAEATFTAHRCAGADRARRRLLHRRNLVPPGPGGAPAEPVRLLRLRPGRVLQAGARPVRGLQCPSHPAGRELGRDGLGPQRRRRGLPRRDHSGTGVRRLVRSRRARRLVRCRVELPLLTLHLSLPLPLRREREGRRVCGARLGAACTLQPHSCFDRSPPPTTRRWRRSFAP